MKLRMKVEEIAEDVKDYVEERKDDVEGVALTLLLIAGVALVAYRKGSTNAIKNLHTKLAKEDPETLVNLYRAFIKK